jgi:hypothetical protein
MMRATNECVNEPRYRQAVEHAGLPPELSWRVVVSPRRTVGLTAESDGSLTIRIPHGMPDEHLTRAIVKRLPWITRASACQAGSSAEHAVKNLIDGENFPFLGRNRQLILAAADSRVRLDADRLMAPSGVRGDDIVRWYTAAGLEWLNERVPQWCVRIGAQEPDLAVRDLGRRWGTCSMGAGPKIALHWALFQLSPRLIDAVIVHEVTHLVEPRHGGKFNTIVEQVIPGHGDRLKELAEEGKRIWMGLALQIS